MNEHRIDVLDNGYVKVIPELCAGADEHFVACARMSTQGAFRGWGKPCATCDGGGWDAEKLKKKCWTGCPTCKGSGKGKPGDERLLAYLWTNRHSTPFEFGVMTFEVRAPIFVFRQWHRHRTQSYNEASARYAPLPALDYVPTVERLLANADGPNKQAGRATKTRLTPEYAERWRDDLRVLQERAQRLYEDGLATGVPKELARLALTVGRYSKMRVTANLLNWLRFERLRLDPHAQPEIQEYARTIGHYIEQRFPRTWALFQEGRGL